MTDYKLLDRVARLERQFARTRVGAVIGIASLAAGTFFGIRHLGNVHHEAFPSYYEKGKETRARAPEPDLKTWVPIPASLVHMRKDLDKKYTENGPTGSETGDTDH
jgi:hypothetical protein